MFRLHRSFGILTLGLLVLAASPVLAGDDGNEEKSEKAEKASGGRYDSSEGYSIKIPEGWQTVSDEIPKSKLKELPESVQRKYNPERTDVMFMDLSTGKGFKDNVNVVVLPKEVPVSKEHGKNLKAALMQQYKSTFSDFSMTEFKATEMADRKAYHVEGAYTLMDYSLYLFQTVMSGPKYSLIVTCTFDKSRKEARMKTCTEVFESVKFGS